jgi:hypothetical protein
MQRFCTQELMNAIRMIYPKYWSNFDDKIASFANLALLKTTQYYFDKKLVTRT